MESFLYRCIFALLMCDVTVGQLTEAEVQMFQDRGVEVSDQDADHWIFKHNGS